MRRFIRPDIFHCLEHEVLHHVCLARPTSTQEEDVIDASPFWWLVLVLPPQACANFAMNKVCRRVSFSSAGSCKRRCWMYVLGLA